MDDAAQLPVTLDEGEDAVTVGNIELGEDKARIGAQQGQARLLQPHIVVIVEIVDAYYPITAVEQRLGDVKADEPGGTGEKDRHDGPGARRRAQPEPAESGGLPYRFAAPPTRVFAR